VLVVGQLLARPYLNSYIGEPATLALCLALAVEMLAYVYDAVLKAERKNVVASGFVTAQKGGEYLSGTLLLLGGVDAFTALVSARILTQFLRLLGGGVFSDVTLTATLSREDLTGVLNDIGHLTVVNFSNLGQEWIDTLLIGALLTRSLVPVYEVAWRLSSLGLFITSAFTSVLYPRIAEWTEEEMTDELQYYSSRAYFYPVALFLALTAGGYVVGEWLLVQIYEPGYAAAWIPLIVLLLARVFYSVGRISLPFQFSAGSDRQIAALGVGAATINALLNVALIPRLQLVGAGIASLCGFVFFGGGAYVMVHRRGLVRLPVVDIAGGLLAALGMGVGVAILWRNVPHVWHWTVVVVMTGAGLYGLLLLALSRLVREDLQQLVALRRTPG
jgi:O-antigen/teichoic acid export membrane protein